MLRPISPQNYPDLTNQTTYFKVVKWLCLAVVFLIPFPRITAIQNILFYLTLLLFLHLSARREIIGPFIKTPMFAPFALFTAWALITACTAINQGESFHDLYAHLIRYIIFFYIVIKLFHSRKDLALLGQAVMVSSAVYSLGLIIYWYLLLHNPLTTRLGAALLGVGVNTIGFVSVFGLVCALHFFHTEKDLRAKALSLFCAVSSGAAPLLTQSRADILAMIAVFAVFFHKNKKVLALFSALILCLVILTPLKDRTLKSGAHYDVRIGGFYYFVEMIKDFPLTGSGFSVDTMHDDNQIDRARYMAKIPKKYQNPVHPHLWPHNMLLNIGVRTGMIGMLLFTFLLYQPARMGWHCLQDKDPSLRAWAMSCLAAYLAYLIKGMLDQTFMHLSDSVFHTILAMMTILWHNRTQPHPKGLKQPADDRLPTGQE